MTESQMTLGMDLTPGIDVEGWHASEKLDGVRAYWDGEKLWTRGGNIINAPDWLIAGLPSGVHVDGEIWAGRGQFETARLSVQNGRWNESIVFRYFDAPSVKGNWLERMNSLAELQRTTWFNSVPIMGVVHGNLEALLQMVLNVGGEGLVLRAPWVDKYEIGRTPNTRKVKAKWLKINM